VANGENENNENHQPSGNDIGNQHNINENSNQCRKISAYLMAAAESEMKTSA
jgi:hypothetical protein